MEQSQFATLCTTMAPMHHRRQGYPFGSLVDFAVDGRGLPVFSLSSLAVHTRNIKTDPKCSIQVQAPGWSGLANARLTLFGDVYPIAEENETRPRPRRQARVQRDTARFPQSLTQRSAFTERPVERT